MTARTIQAAAILAVCCQQGSAATLESVRAEVDSLSAVRVSLQVDIDRIEARLDSLMTVQKELEAERVLLTQSGWELSTYQWDWKPYLTDFKEDLELVFFSDGAYEDLKLEDNSVRVQVQVEGDGKLGSMKLIDREGKTHERDAGESSWEIHYRQRALPDDFPDEYLLVTGAIETPIIRSKPEEEEEEEEEVTEVFVVSDAVGEQIDATERERYGLFKGTAGFVSATYFKRPDGSYYIELVTRDEDGAERKTVNDVVYAGISYVSLKIEKAPAPSD